MNWTQKIPLLKELLTKTGPLWEGTTLSGYAEEGPYHCEDCQHGFKSTKGPYEVTLCKHPVVIADKEVTKRQGGFPIVNAHSGCCEFVKP